MFRSLLSISTALLAVLFLAQSAVAAPQPADLDLRSTCCPTDPTARSAILPKSCEPVVCPL